MVLGIGHLRIFAQEVLEEDRGHRRDVLVAEAQIGAGEAAVAGLHRLHADFAGVVQHVPREDLLRDGHGTRLGGDRRQKDFALHARDIEGEQAAVFDDLARDLVFAGGEVGQRNLFTAADLVDQAEVGGGQHAEVLAILLVNALDVFRDHQLDARTTSRRRATASRLEPLPRRLPLTAQTKPPFFTSLRLMGVSLPHFRPR